MFWIAILALAVVRAVTLPSYFSPGQSIFIHSPLAGSTVQCWNQCNACRFRLDVDVVRDAEQEYHLRVLLDHQQLMQLECSPAVLNRFDVELPDEVPLAHGKHALTLEVVVDGQVVDVQYREFNVAVIHADSEEAQRPPRKVLITFSNEQFSHAARRLGESGLRAGFDEFRSFRARDIDKQFVDHHFPSLCQARGHGYWLWKPYLINRTLHELDDGDLLLYSDAGVVFVHSAEGLFRHAMEDPFGVMTFAQPSSIDVKERYFTKRDAFVLLDADVPEITDTQQRYGTFSMYRVGPTSRKFAHEVLTAAMDPRILTDIPNTLGQPNYEGYVDHRHEQSILSILAKLWHLEAYHDPNGFFDGTVAGHHYGRIMWHHKAQNPHVSRGERYCADLWPVGVMN